MPLSPGDKIGHFEVLSLLGRGGMGEVYKARDTKLKRDVALKVLPEAFARDPERMARFQREAEVLASLNHTNIAQIYGVEERALAMELVEGEAPKGPMAFDEAWKIASQIAAALEYAHDKGIIHRDLKPANIKVTSDVTVKLLDFGLAKAFTAQNDASPTTNENSPTLTIGATEVGVILGTAAYMPPEQAKGKAVDKRADIWSFGVVLYELLTGERLFKGEDTSDTLAQVLTKEPDFTQVPPKVQRLLRRCLEKDPRKRLRDIGDAMELVDVDAEAAPDPATAPSQWWLGWVAWGVAVVALALAAWGWWRAIRPVEEPRVLKMSVLPPEKVALLADIPAVSPDGHRIAFVATLNGGLSLWVRDLGSLDARALPGTEGASLPFWSPDSRFLGFFANGKLKKTEAVGGPVLTLCDAPVGRGGTWNKNDVIVFVPRLISALFRVSAAGGAPVPVTTVTEQEPGHRYPWFLPDNRHFLYTAYGQDQEKDTVYIGDLESTNRRALMRTASNVVYASPGYLLFTKEQTLMAQPFDAATLQTNGDAVPLAEQVRYIPVDIRALFSSSQNGVLAYDSGGAVSNAGSYAQLTWVDRSGRTSTTLGPPAVIRAAAISPDGNSVAINRVDAQSTDIWLYDVARGTNSRFTFGGRYSSFPAWSPDSSHVAFHSATGGTNSIYQKAANGAGKEEVLEENVYPIVPLDWSRDGRYLIEGRTADSKTGSAIWVLPLFGDKKAYPYLQTNANETSAKLSPSGQWLAYQSDENTRNEIYVQTFPQPGGKWQVSTNGGSFPVWSRDGKELFYVGADGKMMAVEVKPGPKFDAGIPKPLFDTRRTGIGYDVGKDGRFLIPVPVEQSGTSPITMVINWTAGLKK